MQGKVNILKYFPALSAGMLCFSLVLPSVSFAQTDTVKKLREVKVNTAPIPNVQTLVPIQQISANAFDRYGAFNVADAIRDFSGVNIKDYGGIGGIKTVSVRGLGADHTAILFDGIAISDAENGQIDLSKFNLSGVQQIILYNAQPENILNPARSFASASIIAINTIQPHLSADKPYQLLLGIKGGSFGLINPYLQWQQRINNRWSFVINSYLENANGHYKFKNTEEGADTLQTRNNADVSDQRIDGALYWFKNDSNKFNLHINYYNSDRGLPGAVIDYNPFSNQRLWNKDFFLQSGYEHSWDNGFQVLLNAKISREYTRYRDPDFQNNQGGIDDRYTQREVYQSAALAYHITQNWQASYDADESFSDLGAFSPINSIYKYAFPSRFTLQHVLASKLSLGRWRFEGDVLYTYVNEWVKVGTATPERTALSPTLMTSFLPFANTDLQLRAFYKDVFREPTFDEQYFFAINGSRNLKPEFSKQYDLGLTYRKAINNILDYITLTIDAYYNTISNKIVAIPNQNLIISSITNLGNVRIEGADIDLKTQTKQVNGWQSVLSVNYTYQYAVDVDRNSAYYLQQIAYTPKNTLALNAGLDYKQAGLYFNQVLSSSRYYLGQSLPENFVQGYGVSDLSFIFKFSAAGKPAVFSTYVNNLFNQEYVIVRSFPMPGRSYLLSFQITI
jgi:vitamin B12 transporter